jgi:predicted ATPase/DNA-binding CsgD family transcriptional regulator
MSQEGDVYPNNLPLSLNRFVGRERELAEVKELLATTRLLTLTGVGGCGKTRLALQLATDLIAKYEHGVWWVELAALFDPKLVPQTIISALGLSEQSGHSLMNVLTDYLRSRKLLLVLDNCEHLVTACAGIVEALLQMCPQLHILTTSREALTIHGEVLWPVPPLQLPDTYYVPPLEGLLKYESIRLFIERARAILPSFRLTSENASAVVQICRRLDGIPLATELAAARVKSLSLEQIIARLDNAYHLLTSGSRTALPRQQTLRAAMDWSYDLLTEQERSVFRRLAVFTGGFTLEAAEAICSSEDVASEEVFDILSRLLEKSLVQGRERNTRMVYHLLETIRQYSRDRLKQAGEMPLVYARHRDWYVSFAERVGPETIGPQQAEWFRYLELEYDNIRSALEWSLVQGDAEFAARIGAAIWHFWLYQSYFSEGRNILERTLKALPGQTALRARLLLAAGLLAFYSGDYPPANDLLVESLGTARVLGERQDIAYALNALGSLERSKGNYEQATLFYQECLPLLRALDEERVMSLALAGWGLTALCLGDYERAKVLCEESLVLARKRGDPQGIAGSLTSLGIALLGLGDEEQARMLCEESLALRRQLVDKGGSAHTLMILGRVAFSQGNYERAAMHYKESLDLRQDIGDREGIAAAFEGLATIAGAQGQVGHAAQLSGAAEVLREVIGAPQTPVDRSVYESAVAVMRKLLDETTFAQAWATGRKLSLEQAILVAQQVIIPEQMPPPLVSTTLQEVQESSQKAELLTDSFGLTAREREVLQLVTLGLTDAQIADKLIISPRTAEAHVRSIYSKLGVKTRSAATRCALSHRLVSLESEQ